VFAGGRIVSAERRTHVAHQFTVMQGYENRYL
jgi:hypothetical protein